MAGLWHDRGGNFAMITALAAVPMVGAAGLAVDYANLSRTRTELQNALDAAALAVAQRGDDISDAEARSIAGAFLTGNLTPAYRNLEVARNGTSVTLRAEAPTPLSFGGLFGWSEMAISASSTADMAFANYEIALVLDTTRSMRENGKLQAMKDAVNGLIDDLSARVTDRERLKFALVPFATFVNVGPQFGPKFDSDGKIKPGTGAEWLDLEGESPIRFDGARGLSRFEIAHELRQDWKGCVETRWQPDAGKPAHDVSDTPAEGSDSSSLFVPAFAPDEPDSYGNSYISYSSDPLRDPTKWDVTAKKLDKYGLKNAAAEMRKRRTTDLRGVANIGPQGWTKPTTNYSSGRGPSHSCGTQPITPLSNDYADLKRKVNAFVADGNTNIMEGVAWGMRVLSPQEPFTEGREPAPDVEKIMIVLTDGANNLGVTGSSNVFRSAYSSFGYLIDNRLTTRRSTRDVTEAMNQKTRQACENAKGENNDEIIVYTIRLEEPDVATGTLLRDCATSPGHYFDSPSRSQLDEVFKRIRDGITKLRLSS